jgi:hypothetical protein
MISINSFLKDCKEAKYKYFSNQDVAAYSVQTTNLDDIVNAEFEKKSIIPDPDSKNPSSKISHLMVFLRNIPTCLAGQNITWAGLLVLRQWRKSTATVK